MNQISLCWGIGSNSNRNFAEDPGCFAKQHWVITSVIWRSKYSQTGAPRENAAGLALIGSREGKIFYLSYFFGSGYFFIYYNSSNLIINMNFHQLKSSSF